MLNMRFKISKDTKMITIVREEQIFTNSDRIQKGAFGDFLEDIREITIPEGVTTIESNAFDGCVNLTSITLPGSLKYIGQNAFAGCEKLETAVLPDSISTVICWGERRVWSIDLVKPFSDLVKHLIEGFEVELNPPLNMD